MCSVGGKEEVDEGLPLEVATPVNLLNQRTLRKVSVAASFPHYSRQAGPGWPADWRLH